MALHTLTFITVSLCSQVESPREISPAELVGSWEGSWETRYLGSEATGIVRIEFELNGSVRTFFPDEEHGTYTLDKNCVSVFWDMGRNGILLLEDVAIEGRTLTAKVGIEGGPLGLAVEDRIKLAATSKPFTYVAKECADCDRFLLEHLNGYSLEVPLAPAATLGWLDRQLSAQALERGLEDAIREQTEFRTLQPSAFMVRGLSDQFQVVVDGSKLEEGPWGSRYRDLLMQRLRELLLPVFGDESGFSVEVKDRTSGLQAFGSIPLLDLNPKFVHENGIRFEHIWAEAVEAIERLPDVSLDGASLEKAETLRKISSTWRLVPNAPKGMVEVERLVLKMQSDGDGKLEEGVLHVHVNYEVHRRRASSRTWHTVSIMRSVSLAAVEDRENESAETIPFDDYGLMTIMDVLTRKETQ